MRVAEEEQLVGRIVDLLEEAGATDSLAINEAVREAKLRLSQREEMRHITNPEACFDRMIQTVASRNFDKEIVEQLASQRAAVLDHVSRVTTKPGNIPCMPVIPNPYAGCRKLLSAIMFGPQCGFVSSELSLVAITDKIASPQKPYWIYDVNRGESTRDTNPQSALALISANRRSPLTATEMLNFCFLTSVLLRHGVVAGGSRWETNDLVPAIYLVNTQPTLTAVDIHENSSLRTPSCRRADQY